MCVCVLCVLVGVRVCMSVIRSFCAIMPYIEFVWVRWGRFIAYGKLIQATNQKMPHALKHSQKKMFIYMYINGYMYKTMKCDNNNSRSRIFNIFWRAWPNSRICCWHYILHIQRFNVHDVFYFILFFGFSLSFSVFASSFYFLLTFWSLSVLVHFYYYIHLILPNVMQQYVLFLAYWLQILSPMSEKFRS